MTCPHCLSTSISKRQHRTSLGYRTFSCRACRLRFNERTGSPFNDLQFPTDVAGSSVARCCTGRTSTSTTVSSRIIGHSSNATTRCWVSADSIQPAVSALPSTSCAITCVSEIPEAKEFPHHAVARSSAADGQP